MVDVETVVIGAGVVGLAIARALAISGREVLVLERAAQVGTETSSRNSEVIHSGIYYPAGSLKARLCVAGRMALYAYCQARGIPCRRTGKLVVATSSDEVGKLDQYRKQALRNWVEGVEWRSREAAQELEPALECVRALHVPCTGIVDSHALMMALWSDLEAAGGEVAFRSEVIGGRRVGRHQFELDVLGVEPSLRCKEVINAAGLHAPALARLLPGCGGEQAPEAHFARGHYFTLTGRAPFSHLVYPVAEAGGLGIHVTLDLAGQVRFGPDVEWVEGVDYHFDETRHGRFAEAIRRYYPALDESRLTPGYVGIRPKISGPGRPAADFRIDTPETHGIAGLYHLYGIESPGLTACLAIADRVANSLQAM